jgi:hypothetical protein
MGIKPSDNFAVGLCRLRHREAECNEVAFQEKYGVDLLALAHEYALASPNKAVRETAKAASPAPAIVVSKEPNLSGAKA